MLCTVMTFESICPDFGLNQEPLDLRSHALPSELSRHVVATCMSLYDSGMITVILQTILQNTLIIMNMNQGGH